MSRVHVPTMPELAAEDLATVRMEPHGKGSQAVYTPTPEGQARINAALAHNAQQPALAPAYRRPES